DDHIGVVFPFIDNFLVFNEVVLGTGTVNYLDGAVLFVIVTAVVDNRADRSEADTAGDNQQVFAEEISIDGEAVAVRATDRNLLTGFHSVQPAGDAATFFDRELHVFGVGGG